MALNLEHDSDPSSDYLPNSQESSDTGSDGGDSRGGAEEKDVCDEDLLYETRVATMVAKREMYHRNKLNSGRESDAEDTPSKTKTGYSSANKAFRFKYTESNGVAPSILTLEGFIPETPGLRAEV